MFRTVRLLTPAPVLLALIGCSPSQPPSASSDAQAPLPSAVKKLEIERVSVGTSQPFDPLVQVLSDEVRRNAAVLSAEAKAPLHHLAYELSDQRRIEISASRGELLLSQDRRRRLLDVDARVGTNQLDNTHPREDEAHYQGAEQAPLVNDRRALSQVLWLATEAAYKRAASELIQVKASRQRDAGERREAPDFSSEPPVEHASAPAQLVGDAKAWEDRVQAWSAVVPSSAAVERTSVSLELIAATRWLVTSEGTRLQTGATHARITISAEGTAKDGTRVERTATVDAHDPSKLPPDDGVKKLVAQTQQEAEALLEAPRIQPFVGPALLEGKAAAVLFHEIFGHRVEGHRQKGILEGQTFTEKVGQQIVSDAFDVYDDPSLKSANGIDLNGFYSFDSEGVEARKATLIEGGVLRGFLLGRSPIRGFPKSNGHGRRAPGYRAVARQANLIVDPRQVTTRKALNEAFLREIVRQKLPFGLRVSEVEGGYTLTERAAPQAFKVEPVLVYRVFPDGREELVRGLTLEGTPLAILGEIVAAGDDFQVFNGYCGAESGFVPASAVAPSLFVRRIEVTREERYPGRPPLLPPPSTKDFQRSPAR